MLNCEVLLTLYCHFPGSHVRVSMEMHVSNIRVISELLILLGAAAM